MNTVEADKQYYLDPDSPEAQEMRTAVFEDSPDPSRLKLEINEIVWRNVSRGTTMEKAEEIATNFWQQILETHT